MVGKNQTNKQTDKKKKHETFEKSEAKKGTFSKFEKEQDYLYLYLP